MTQVISHSPDLELPPDDVRDAIIAAVCAVRPRILSAATLITRIDDGGALDQRGPLTHVVTELLLDAATAFAGEPGDGNVVVVTCQRIAGYATIRISDNAPGTPRHAEGLAGLIERLGGDMRIETDPDGGCTVTLIMPVAG